MKDINQTSEKKRPIGVRSERVPNMKLLCLQDVLPSWHIDVYPQSSSQELWCPEFLFEFCYIGMID